MKTINDALDALRAQTSDAQRRTGQAEAARKAAAEDLTKRIKAGETTGDRLVDFLVASFGAGYEEALPHYRALEERMKGRTGQFVLMIERAETQFGCVMFGEAPDHMFGLEETFVLGILSSDALAFDLEARDWKFPAVRHVSQGGRWNSGSKEGGFAPRFYSSVFWMKMAEPMRVRGLMPDAGLGVERGGGITPFTFVIGDEEIEAWCRRGAMHFKKAAPNEARCELIRKLAGQLGSDATSIPAVAQAADRSGKKLLEEIEKRVVDLKSAMTDLYDTNVRPHADIVKAIRDARRDIRRLLERAQEIGLDTPFIQRLRAAHCDPVK